MKPNRNRPGAVLSRPVRLLRQGGLAVWLVLCAASAGAQAVDAAAADTLLKANKCGKCHSLDKQKDGPSFRKTAGKYKGKADAEATLVKHLTTSPKVKIDGVEEEHTAIKNAKEAEVRNLVRWILSQ